jgi:hypothetical protein
MIKLLKVFLSLAVVVGVAAAGFVVYRLWDQGELKKENFSTEAMGQLLKQEAEKLGSEVKEGSIALKNKIQHEWVDWDELKGNWTLSEDEFEAFKKDSLAFLSMDEEVDPITTDKEEELPVQKVTSAKPEPQPTTSSKAPTEPKKVVVKKTPKAPEPRAPRTAYPTLDKSRAFTQGMADLNKAKEYNRKGLPGKPNAKGNLKKAVSYYRKAQKKMAEASRAPGLNSKEEARLEKLQQEIGKQIYWGSKLGTL